MEVFFDPNREEWEALTQRPQMEKSSLRTTIDQMYEDIQQRGTEALCDYTQRFDGQRLESLAIRDSELQRLSNLVSPELKEAILVAHKNITKFHQAQVREEPKVETTPGVLCWRKSLPLERVGIYIPGGSAPLFSTVLMLAIPAKIAGCKQVVLCSPPGKDHIIHPAIAYCALLCQVDLVCSIGGAQAILAMAMGVGEIPRVDKILGPGNQYVTQAKQKALELGISIDMPAGPSEVMVVADQSSDATFVAADLLSQAEHGPDSQVMLVSLCRELIDEVRVEIDNQLSELPRQEIATRALQHARMLYFSEQSEAVDFMNAYAAEHLILALDRAGDWVDLVRHAGSVFVGHYSPESVGDYASGTNHTLPTYGYARMYGGVSTDTFVKKTTFQHLSREGLLALGQVVQTMARAEELEAHARAVDIRIKKIR